MNLIDLDNAKPGMTLAKSVYTQQEVLLLKPDVRLTEKNILILKSWGIHQIWIDDAAGENVVVRMSPEHEIRTFIDDELRAKFSETLPDPLMEEILRIAGNLLEKRLLKKDNKHGAQKS
jgi:hypothetical protein